MCRGVRIFLRNSTPHPSITNFIEPSSPLLYILPYPGGGAYKIFRHPLFKKISRHLRLFLMGTFLYLRTPPPSPFFKIGREGGSGGGEGVLCRAHFLMEYSCYHYPQNILGISSGFQRTVLSMLNHLILLFPSVILLVLLFYLMYIN